MHYNASIGSHTKARGRGLPREECSFSTAPVSKYHDDLFGGSGCGTNELQILLHDNDVADHDSSTMKKKKRKRDTTKSQEEMLLLVQCLVPKSTVLAQLQ
jgi:hypothetical protein